MAKNHLFCRPGGIKMEIFVACFLGAWIFAACVLVVRRLKKELGRLEGHSGDSRQG